MTSLCADLSNGIRVLAFAIAGKLKTLGFYHTPRLGEVDAWQQCYPTWTGDVASVLKNMVELHLAGECLQGIYHFQSCSAAA